LALPVLAVIGIGLALYRTFGKKEKKRSRK
jgi:hypothetical protein